MGTEGIRSAKGEKLGLVWGEQVLSQGKQLLGPQHPSSNSKNMHLRNGTQATPISQGCVEVE